MPPALYDVMVAAVRDAQAVKASPVPPDDVVAVPREVFAAMIAALAPAKRPAPATEPTQTPVDPPPDLPRAVQDAIAMYAFGDPVEEAANYHRAVALNRAGKRADEIVRELRMGGNVETFI